MSVALRPLQEIRPSAEPRVWTCLAKPDGEIRLDLSRDEIIRALNAPDETLWVDIDTRDRDKVGMLRDIFHFHPLAIEEAVNPESRVKLEEFNDYVLLIVRTLAFLETTDDPYDLETANIAFFLGKSYLVTVHGENTNPVDS